MPFNWRDYLGLAQELSQRQDEAAIRSAISRAYYAALCSARLHLETEDGLVISTMGTDSHTQIWNAFQKKGKAANAIYQKGKSLKHRRQKADYEHTVDKLSHEVAAALEDANTIFHWLAKLS